MALSFLEEEELLEAAVDVGASVIPLSLLESGLIVRVQLELKAYRICWVVLIGIRPGVGQVAVRFLLELYVLWAWIYVNI